MVLGYRINDQKNFPPAYPLLPIKKPVPAFFDRERRPRRVLIAFAVEAVCVLSESASPAHRLDTSRHAPTMTCSVDTAYGARTLRSADRSHAWKKHAIYTRSPDCTAKEYLEWNENYSAGRRFSFFWIQPAIRMIIK
jgi:hypothetical protein